MDGSSAALSDGSPVPGTKLIKCLEPLRNVRGANFVKIDGPGQRAYLAEIEATMLGNCLSAAELMELVGKHFDCGDIALREGNLKVAMIEYKAALCTIRSIQLGKRWE